jgi:pentose-5-phosphate-3-epimerase
MVVGSLSKRSCPSRVDGGMRAAQIERSGEVSVGTYVLGRTVFAVGTSRQQWEAPHESEDRDATLLRPARRQYCRCRRRR